MRRRPEVDDEGRFPLPPRATAIVLGTWTTVLVVLALVVVPLVFGQCFPAPAQ